MQELRLYSLDDLWMRPAMREETIASEPVDIFASIDILYDGSVSLPLNGSMIPGECDALAVFEPSLIEVFTEIRE